MEFSQTDVKPESLPSYEESLNSPLSTPAPIPLPPPSLPQQLVAARSARTFHLIDTVIFPHLRMQALSGISKTILVLVPSNVYSLQPSASISSEINPCISDDFSTSTFPGEIVVGFRADEDVALVRLIGEEHTLEFWRQPIVMRDLERRLRWRLVEEAQVSTNSDQNEPLPVNFGLISQDASRRPSEKDIRSVQVTTGEATGMARESGTADYYTLKEHEVAIGVAVQEVCLRIVSEMGLYETRSGKTIVVRAEFCN